MANYRSIKYLHVDKTCGPAVKNHFLKIETDDQKVDINLTEKDVSVLADFLLNHHCSQIEPKGRLKVTVTLILKIIKIWTHSSTKIKF